MKHRSMSGISTPKMMSLHNTGKTFTFGLPSNIERITFLKNLYSQNISRCLCIFFHFKFTHISIKIFSVFLLMAPLRLIEMFRRNRKVSYLSCRITFFF
ncbi:hypothetical protein BOX24_10535 [Leptospirillum ferriphilum]|uniref:Uncharacterized protein n=1 Tax=Leptospirillum ferriphilum TaxID=178606 RepID=A0A1V3SSN4_9BACT|nr:hypothetical protein BOX24_10535 [Leptospirillum ferriphilum]